MKAWPRSLAARILLAEVAAIGVALTLLPLLLITGLNRTAAVYQGRELAGQAARIARAVVVMRGQVRVTLPQSLAGVYEGGFNGLSYLVLDAKGRWVAQAGPAPAIASGAPRTATGGVIRAGRFTAASAPALNGGQPLWVVVSQDEAEPGAILDDVARAFLSRYTVLLVAILLTLALVNVLIVRQLFRAVRRVSADAAAIGPASLDRRLDESGVPAEILPLVRATNVLVARVGDGVAQQREFIANVVHELRTPLGALRMQIDRLDRSAARSELERTVDRVSHVVSQLKDLAALETIERRRSRFDLRAAVEDAVAEHTPEVFANGDRIGSEAPEAPVTVEGEPTLVRLAVGNLINNATRHTPPGTVIVVIVDADGRTTVADDGPGVATAAESSLTRRFWRAGQQRADTAGLGLSIVQRIADVHDATLAVDAAPCGGARFTLHFPLAS